MAASKNGIKKSTVAKAAAAERRQSRLTTDSFQNIMLKLGMGTDNALSSSTYGFNPVTRVRTLLEWIYRGSWMGPIAVDIIADDMTRAGIDVTSQMDPKQLDTLNRAVQNLNFWGNVNDCQKWARLYGGSIMVPMIDGQDPSTPLRLDTIARGQLKSFLVLDRWQVEGRLEQLVGPEDARVGEPMYYRVNSDAPALRGKNIHYTRVFRMLGVKLPYWQAVQENLWGLSIFERIYDRMVSLDSSTQGAAQSVYKSWLRVYKMKGLTDLLATGGDAGIATVMRKMDMTRRFMSNEGMTVVDGEDDVTALTNGSFAGVSDVILQQAQQISGTLQTPLVRMFGQSPAGLNSTGESDLRTYYDGVNTKQEREFRAPVHQMYRIMGQSAGVPIPEDFAFTFRPLWQLSEVEKSEISARDATSIAEIKDAGIIDLATSLKELKQNSVVTSRFDNITDEMIEQAELEPQDALGEDLHSLGLSDDEYSEAGMDPSKIKHPNPIKSSMQELASGSMPTTSLSETLRPASSKPMTGDRRRTVDSLPQYTVARTLVAVENMKGSTRTGPGWSVVMPCDYGYAPATDSAEGDMEFLDCMIGPDRDSEDVWIVDTIDPRTGSFDEHKCFLGFSSQAEVEDCFSQCYHDQARGRMGGITHMDLDAWTAWRQSGDHKRPVKKMRVVS